MQSTDIAAVASPVSWLKSSVVVVPSRSMFLPAASRRDGPGCPHRFARDLRRRGGLARRRSGRGPARERRRPGLAAGGIGEVRRGLAQRALVGDPLRRRRAIGGDGAHRRRRHRLVVEREVRLLQRLLHRARVPEAIFTTERERPIHHRGERGRHVGRDGGDRRARLRRGAHHDLGGAVGLGRRRRARATACISPRGSTLRASLRAVRAG